MATFVEGLRIITIAPELRGAPELIARLAAWGVRVSLGHSAANVAQSRAGYAAGAVTTTHLFNAMVGVTHREPGLALEALLDDAVWVELIADTLHVDPDVWPLIWAVKPTERVLLVSDAISLAGSGVTRGMVGELEVRVDGEKVTLVEGGNLGPELEPSLHVGYALGHARTATDEGGQWRLTGWESSGSPKVGADPPACTDGTCTDNRSVREPHLLAELNEEQELRDLVLSFAREVVTDPLERDLFGIQVVRPIGGPTTGLTLPSAPTLSPDDIPECVSLRDPALIPVDPDSLQGYWLLFTCVQSGGATREIHAVRISRALEVVQEGGGPMRRLVLAADELGPFASEGIRSPEPVVSFEENGMRLRIWFLAQSTPGDWSVALAEARTHDTSMLEFDLPEPVPFPVNPVLGNASTLVRSGCLGAPCSITGIAVTPRADDPDRLRFLLARRLYLPGAAPTDQLIPLEQTWRKP